MRSPALWWLGCSRATTQASTLPPAHKWSCASAYFQPPARDLRPLDHGTCSNLYNSEMQPRPYRSGELAKLTGVSTDTLRFYERNRLLPPAPRAANGYRCYPPESLQR